MPGRKLRRFVAGAPLLSQLTAGRLNDILAAIEASAPVAGPGIKVANLPGGSLVALRKVQDLGGGGSGLTLRFIRVGLSGTADGFPDRDTLATNIGSAYDSNGLAPAVGDFLWSSQFHWIVGPHIDATGASTSSAVDTQVDRIFFAHGGGNWTAFQLGPNKFVAF